MKNRLFLTMVSLLFMISGCSGEGNVSMSPSSENKPDVTEAPRKLPYIVSLVLDEVYMYGYSRANQDKIEKQRVRFNLNVGDRIEGEVTASDGGVICSLYDPYGNLAIGSARRDVQMSIGGSTYFRLQSAQKYPWKFVFVAVLVGEYYLQLDTGDTTYSPRPSANAQLTIYPIT